MLLCDAQMAYYPVTNYLYIRRIRAVLHRDSLLTVLYVDGGYNLHVGDGSFQGVYTRLTCTGLVRGGRGPCAISRLLMCWVSVCRPTEAIWVWRSGPHCTGTLGRRRCPEALHSAVLDDSLAEDVALELMRLGDEVRRRRAARRAAPVLCEKLLTCGEHRLRLLGELLLHLSRNLGL